MIAMTQLKYSGVRFANETVAFPQQGVKKRIHAPQNQSPDE